MRVRIICYEDPNLWILGKFAKKLNQNLIEFGIQSDISNKPDRNADINHHIIFSNYNGAITNNDTLMITHVDNIDKLNLLKSSLKNAKLGICMSSETMFFLVNSGIDKDKLCYINPAHDQIVKIKKIVIGIFCRVQPDGRKREHFLIKLSNYLDPNIFKFIIMGDSWDSQVNHLIKNSFEVDYYNNFNIDIYYSLFQELDYYLYMGMDEGQMGVLDAHSAGVKTIVTSQGYHLDLKNSITHSFEKFKELLDIFLIIQQNKKLLIESVSNLTWRDYTLKHLECWSYLLYGKKIDSEYIDGYNSIFQINNVRYNQNKSKFHLILNKYSHYYNILKKRFIN